MGRITIPVLQDFVRIRGDKPCKVLNILPYVDNVYNVLTSPAFVSLPEDHAIKRHGVWVIFYQN